MSEWIKKHYPTLCCPQDTNFNYKDTYRLKTSRWIKINHASTNQKTAGVAILTSDRADFEIRKVIRDKERFYRMIKGSVLQEDTNS